MIWKSYKSNPVMSVVVFFITRDITLVVKDSSDRNLTRALVCTHILLP